MNLIIVESPTKAKTLSRFLGEDYVVKATMGHIKDLPKSKLGIDIDNNFSPEYLIIEKKEAVIKEIGNSSKTAKKVYLATDPDREGEAIAQHVEEILSEKDIMISSEKDKKKHLISKYPNISISRIVFHEITKEAVDEALANPRDIDKNLVDAQIARRVLDRLVGYKLSPLLWRKVRRGLSAGRVQTVAVKLIVEKEREIEKFKAEEYWEIFATVSQLVSKSVSQFVVQLVKTGEKIAEIKNEKDARLIVAGLKAAKYKVADVKKREVRKNPYPPYTTSTMTQAAARIFGWSAKRTMSVAQKLYEEGLITYHRTDSVNLAKGAIEKVRVFIKKGYGDNYLPETPKFYKTKSKVAQEAHEAIRPTKLDAISNFQFPISNQFSNDSKKLYELIWRRFVACQMVASVYDETTIDVQAIGSRSVGNSNEDFDNYSSNHLVPISYLLRASGQVMRFEGWRAVYGELKAQSSKLKVEEVTLPKVAKDEVLQLIKVDSQQKFTEPPARFNEASLIKTLEKLGIGRPSTYAPTISTIQIRNYIEKKEGRFYPTPVGIAANDFLISNFPETFDYQFTAFMENDLDEIANGKENWAGAIKTFWKPFSKKLESVGKNSKRVKIETEKLGKSCPECKQGELVIRIGRFGKFISCSRFPDCKYTEKYIEKIGIKCPECIKGEIIIKRSKKGRTFYGCSRYPACNFVSWKRPKNADEARPE